MHIRKQTLPILIIAASYTSIYGLLSMKNLYYDLIRTGLSLSHFRLGQLYSLYGIFAMFSYLCGAWFMKYFNCRLLICTSLILSGVTFLSLAVFSSFPLFLVLFGLNGFIIGAAFYPAYLEILHQIGSSSSQNSAFGLFFLGNSLFGMSFAFIGSLITCVPVSAARRTTLLMVYYGILNLLMAFLCYLSLKNYSVTQNKYSQLSLKSVPALLKNRRLWLAIIIILCNYILFSSQSYLIPYFNTIVIVPAGFISIFAIVRTYLIRALSSPLAGILMDRIRLASRLMLVSFILFTAVMLLFLCGRHNIFTSVLLILLICLSICMGKSMALIVIDETAVSPELYGLAISLTSFLAYSPDAFYYSISGWILDSFPAFGYQVIFLIAVIFSLIGLSAALLLQHNKDALEKRI